MSDVSTIEPDNEELEPNPGEQLPNPARAHMRKLEEENKELKEKAAKSEQVEKEFAIHKAGLADLNEVQTEALFLTHKGDITPEALQQTAEKLGYFKPEPETDPAVQQAHEQVNEASKGATTVNPSSYDDELAAASTPDEVKAAALKAGIPWDDSAH